MDWLFPIVVVLPLLAFWMWMFSDMINNTDLPRWPFWDVTDSDSLPSRRFNWTLAFALLNVFAAAIYYSTVYTNS